MKNLNFIGLLIVFVLFSRLLIAQETAGFQSEMLSKIWETPQELAVPESVCYDPSSGNLFVSNVNGKPTEKDGNGFISILSLNGNILERSWIAGLNAPKGMGIYNGVLYVTDIDRVVAIDIKMKEILKQYDFPEAKFLNDIAVDSKGGIYISDMMSTRVYKISDDKSEIWMDDPRLTNPNGLFVENDQLMIGCNKIMLTNILNRKTIVWLEETGGIDGLEGTGDGRYLFSDWQGNVYLIDKDKKIEKILDTTPQGINAADIEFIPEKRMLLVPTFSDNRVAAYELK